MTHEADLRELAAAEEALRSLLPPMYQVNYDAVGPVSMGSAGLKYHDDGHVLWNEMWGSFCDLAMAGGPPHKGALLLPATAREIDSDRQRHDAVVDELCRGITLVSGLPASRSMYPGWIAVTCPSDGMAAWLLRAITVENVAVRAHGPVLELPAGPAYRLDKEIKNVITVIAKTCHYWQGHIPPAERFLISDLIEDLNAASPLLEPGPAERLLEDREQAARIAAICRLTGLDAAPLRYAGWLGVECPSVRAAVWMMRMLVAGNVLARREDRILYVPDNRITDADGSRAASALHRVYRFASSRQILTAA